MNKKKIINDPVYGFIAVPSTLIFDLIQEPYLQRLRNIKQLGMTHLVYPGASHTRFQHVLGAMHLMQLALEILKSKGHEISPEEEEAATAAILLHDIGHGPFSHSLEHTLVQGISHEEISVLFMKNLNGKYQGRLEKALEIFQKQYDKKFLCQLVSSQLDVDRLDYLNRDSFFTGVSEGVIGFERILKMLNVKDGKLVVEEKGLHSVANFLIARRLMYWQVYLHKTAVAAECMLIKVLQRARLLAMRGANLFATPNLHYFLYNAVTKGDFETNVHCLARFAELDDADIYTAIKVWTEANDVILSTLSRCLTQRYLFRIEITSQKPAQEAYEQLIEKAQSKYQVSREDASYLVTGGVIKNDGYQHGNEGMIQILMKDHSIQDILSISDHFSLEALMKAEKRYVLCYDRGLTERL